MKPWLEKVRAMVDLIEREACLVVPRRDYRTPAERQIVVEGRIALKQLEQKADRDEGVLCVG